MTLEQFAIETKVLEDYYAMQKKMWFEKLKYYDTERYTNALEFLCATSRYFPLLSEVLEATRNQQSKANDVEVLPCELCKGTGYILYKKKINDTEYDYACLCICQNADGKDYNGMRNDDKDRRSPFYIKTAQEVFGEAIPKPEKKKVETTKNVNQIVKDLVEQMEF